MIEFENLKPTKVLSPGLNVVFLIRNFCLIANSNGSTTTTNDGTTTILSTTVNEQQPTKCLFPTR